MSHCLNLFQDAAGGIWKLDLSFTHTVSSKDHLSYYYKQYYTCDSLLQSSQFKHTPQEAFNEFIRR